MYHELSLNGCGCSSGVVVVVVVVVFAAAAAAAAADAAAAAAAAAAVVTLLLLYLVLSHSCVAFSISGDLSLTIEIPRVAAVVVASDCVRQAEAAAGCSWAKCDVRHIWIDTNTMKASSFTARTGIIKIRRVL